MKKLLISIILGILYSASSYSEEITLPIHSNFHSAVAWSPDSSKIAIGAQGAIFVIDASSGKITKTIARERFAEGAKGPGDIFHIDWSPDGKKLAVCRMDVPTVHYPEDIWIIDLNDGTAENVTHSKPYTYCRTPKWSPDGRFIVFGFEKRDTIPQEDSDELEHVFTEEVATLNLETGDINTLGTGCCPEWSKDRHKLIILASYNSVGSYSIDYVEESQELFPDTKSLLTTEQRLWLLYGINDNSPQKIRQFSCDEECLSPDGEKLIIKISTSLDHFGFVLKKQ